MSSGAPTVVPAIAGTHSHTCRGYAELALQPVSEIDSGGYGSRLKAGTTIR